MEIYDRLTPIFRDTFDNDNVILSPTLTAEDVEEWDSLSHIRLIVAIEQEFNIRFGVSEIDGLKNVGELVKLIQIKLK